MSWASVPASGPGHPPAFRTGSTEFMRGFLLDQAGMLLVKIGQPSEALHSYRQAVDCLAENPERQLQTLLHLCETQIEVGFRVPVRFGQPTSRR
jgi:hypothetical protein